MRISRDNLHMGTAMLHGMRSTCNRLQVGCVIVRDKRIICTGYNGAPSGSPHCSDQICNLAGPCTRTIHAEQNAIYNAAKFGVELVGTTLFTTHSPCLTCCHAIIQAGIKEVVYLIPYRDVTPIEVLVSKGVITRKYEEPVETTFKVQDLFNLRTD